MNWNCGWRTAIYIDAKGTGLFSKISTVTFEHEHFQEMSMSISDKVHSSVIPVLLELLKVRP